MKIINLNPFEVLIRTLEGFRKIVDGFNSPLTGINYYQGNIYVSHRGSITVIKRDGAKEDILTGLPSWGDNHNNRVVFGDMNTGMITPFAINKSGFAANYTGGGGLERPIDVVFGNDGVMYVADFSWRTPGESEG